MKELENYLKYLQYQKNYSLHTITSYEEDIKEFLEYIKSENINMFKITYDDSFLFDVSK